MATFDPTRLYSTLLNTGLQVKDNALYQVIHDLIAALATINKQTNSLATSSSTPSVVTNIIQQLTEITDFGFEDFQIPNINSSVTNVVNNVNNTVQQIIGDSSSDFSALDDFQIPGPTGPAGPIVPYFIGVNEVFLVPIFKQALFAMNIEVQGILEVDGFLIEVETAPTGQVTITTTGNIDDLNFSDANLIRMNNASLATIRGLQAGLPGQRVTIVSVGAGQVDLSHQNTGDAVAANRLINTITSFDSSLSAGVGFATYEYDGTTARWRMVQHTQGVAIPFTSSWTATGVAPSIGNGTIVSTYLVTGSSVDVQIILTTGTTTTFGTGDWRFSVKGSSVAYELLGSLATDAFVANFFGFSTFITVNTINYFDSNSTLAASATAPFTWEGDGDVLVLSSRYSVA